MHEAQLSLTLVIHLNVKANHTYSYFTKTRINKTVKDLFMHVVAAVFITTTNYYGQFLRAYSQYIVSNMALITI